MSAKARQLPLTLRWPPRQRFAHFRVAAGNAEALALAQDLASRRGAPWVLLHGPAGCGKTHLLIAACQLAQAERRSSRYAAAARLTDAEAMRALSGADFLALDGLDAVAGNAATEHALFDLYNRLRAAGTTLLMAAREPLKSLPLVLPDLRSRLGTCVQVSVSPLGEAARRALVQDWAQERGLALDPPALDWLFARAARDLHSLQGLFERIDRAALAERRRITIPFLRTLLAEGD